MIMNDGDPGKTGGIFWAIIFGLMLMLSTCTGGMTVFGAAGLMGLACTAEQTQECDE